MFYLLGIIIGLVISFLITAVLIWILAMCFGFMFTWKLALGVWVIYLIIKSIFTTLLPLPVAPAISKWDCCSISE